MLEFASPMLAWWAALTVPIFLIYIIKVRLRRRPVSTLLFWNQLFDEKKPRAWWQQLRHWLSLLLQLAFVLLLVGALIDPLWSWQKNSQRRIVLIVDNSASMKATEASGITRLQSAKEIAKGLARSLRPGDEMSLVSSGGQSVVHVGLTNHARLLIDGITELPETDAPSVLLSAIATAERLLKDRVERSEIIVLTDGCIEDFEIIKNNPLVKIYGVGKPQENTAITRYQVRRSVMDSVGYQVLIEVTNSGLEEVKTKLELSLEDNLVDVVPITLKAGESQTRILDHTSATGGKLIAKLDSKDALSTDNSAISILPQRAPLPITLVTKGSLFLKSVLESMPLVELTITEVAPEAAPKSGLLVLDRIIPEKLPRGRLLIVDPQNNADLMTVGETLEQPLVARVEKDSPLTQHIRLDNVLFPGAKQMTFTRPVESLIRDPLDSPMLARMKRPGGDLWILTCNLEQSDLPLRIAFPVLIKNAIEWFQGNEGQLSPVVPTGTLAAFVIPEDDLGGINVEVKGTDPSADALSPTKGQEAVSLDSANDSAVAVESAAPTQLRRDFHVSSPSGKSLAMSAEGEQALIGPILECGLWIVAPASDSKTETKDGTQRTASNAKVDYRWAFASNLTNRSESDLKPRGELLTADALSVVSLGGRAIWFYLAMLGLLLVTTEWWLYQRRVVG
jgi:von Willebrand factor type A domain/Aerotolerance regulator N-terminal